MDEVYFNHRVVVLVAHFTFPFPSKLSKYAVKEGVPTSVE